MTSPSRSRSHPKGDLSHVLEDEARLEALRRTSLLDSQPEETFDRLTRLAAALQTGLSELEAGPLANSRL